MTMTDTPLDFEKVELVRDRMGLTVTDMAKFFGVSRMTYYKWVNGGTVRAANKARAKSALRDVLPLLREGHWPLPNHGAMDSGQRLTALLEILEAAE